MGISAESTAKFMGEFVELFEGLTRHSIARAQFIDLMSSASADKFEQKYR